jgi:ribonuclease HI
MKQVSLTTDGACIGNPGPGGWACILRYQEHKRELVGSELHSTNNRMELRAVLAGLSALKEPCRVVVRTDSQYLRNGMTSWIYNWKKRGWVHHVRGSGQQPVKNRDLWQALDEIAKKHEITWQWVKGHASDRDNNRCDELATRAARANGGSGGKDRSARAAVRLS